MNMNKSCVRSQRELLMTTDTDDSTAAASSSSWNSGWAYVLLPYVLFMVLRWPFVSPQESRVLGVSHVDVTVAVIEPYTCLSRLLGPFATC